MIRVLTEGEVLAYARDAYALPEPKQPDTLIDDAFLAASLRRLGGFLCPCSPKTLNAAAMDTLRYLVPPTLELTERIDYVLEALQAGGDFLELSRVTTLDERTRGTWLFSAPPSFVVHESGKVHVFGMSPEDVSPLPDSLRSRVRTAGTTRFIQPIDGEDLGSLLRVAGLREQSMGTWLKLPSQMSAAALRQSLDARLNSALTCAQIDGLRILDSSNAHARYADRWVLSSNATGRFVCRRSQAYGSDLWGYVEIINGEPRKLLDFPLLGSAYRGCDDAWRLQLAIDCAAGHPQEFRLRPHAEGIAMDVFFPLPLWAQRRLELVGRAVDRQKSLLSYVLPEKAVASECAFLESAVWMKQAN